MRGLRWVLKTHYGACPLPAAAAAAAPERNHRMKSDTRTQMLADIRPNEEHAKEHIERNPVTTVAQVVPEMSEHEVSHFTECSKLHFHEPVFEGFLRSRHHDVVYLCQVNTTAVVFATKAMNHVEGGWPKEVDYTEAEHVIRYRKKVSRHSKEATLLWQSEKNAPDLPGYMPTFVMPYLSCLHEICAGSLILPRLLLLFEGLTCSMQCKILGSWPTMRMFADIASICP